MHKPDTRQVLLAAATRVFARLGYDGATVKDIAKEARANVSLISYYFDGKEGIYKAVVESFGHSKLRIAESILTAPTSLEEMRYKLTLWLEHVLDAHVLEPDITMIIHRECERQFPVAKDVFERTLKLILERVMGFFAEAQSRALLRPDVDAKMVGLLTVSGIIHIGTHQHVLERAFGTNLASHESRRRLVATQVESILVGCAPPSRTKIRHVSRTMTDRSL
jgi:TetR/AcrR family transcriptional regulator